MRLELLIKEFENKYNKQIYAYIRHFQRIKTIEDAIFRAVMALQPNGKMYDHQYMIPKKAIDLKYKRVIEIKNQILQVKNFDEIYNFIESEKVRNYGLLSNYDASLRIGFFLNIFPEKIYIQRGTKTGAYNLSLNVKNKRSLSIEEIPPQLRRLPPYKIEMFLCIYKTEFKNL